MLCGLPSFCSPAMFLAARWLIFLRAADHDRYHADLSTLVLALSKRGNGLVGIRRMRGRRRR